MGRKSQGQCERAAGWGRAKLAKRKKQTPNSLFSLSNSKHREGDAYGRTGERRKGGDREEEEKEEEEREPSRKRFAHIPASKV